MYFVDEAIRMVKNDIWMDSYGAQNYENYLRPLSEFSFILNFSKTIQIESDHYLSKMINSLIEIFSNKLSFGCDFLIKIESFKMM